MSDETGTATAETPAPDAEVRKEATLGLPHVLLIALACSTISGFAAWKLSISNALQQPRMVAVDYARLASMQVEQAGKTANSREEAVRMAENFAHTLNGITKEYADRGYWILDSERILAVPYGNDITDEIAERLRVAGSK